jgi:hypothetical protein
MIKRGEQEAALPFAWITRRMIENAEAIAVYESPRTTKRCDRNGG